MTRQMSLELNAWHMYKPIPGKDTSDFIAVRRTDLGADIHGTQILKFAKRFLNENAPDNILPIEVSLCVTAPTGRLYNAFGNDVQITIRGVGSWGIDMKKTEETVKALADAIEHKFFLKDDTFTSLQRRPG